MKQGDKLIQSRRSRSFGYAPQSGYIGLSEGQIKSLVNTGEFDKIPLGEKKSMGGRKVYGWNSTTYDHGLGDPKWNVVGRWLRKRIGQSKSRVEKDFIDFWKNGKMDETSGMGPTNYLNKYLIDSEEHSINTFRRGFYWDENDILRMYPERRMWRNEWPDYNTAEKRKANKLVFEENKLKISGNGPISIGKYYIKEDRAKELHSVLAIRTDIWNQNLPEKEQYRESKTLKPCVKASSDFLHWIHNYFEPVQVLGVGDRYCKKINSNHDWWLREEIINYMFVVVK